MVMDGNGRWAQRQGLPRTDGHAAGEEALMDTIWGALDAGIRWHHGVRLLDRELAAAGRRGPFLMSFNERLLRDPARRAERQEREGPVPRAA